MMSVSKQGPRYYIPHHLIFYPVMGIILGYCFYNAASGGNDSKVWLFIGLCFFSVIALAFMLRQHYALGNQDRIVRLEMRYRYFAITGKRFEQIENQISFKQLAALRFASDSELPALTDRIVSEKLTPSDIKSQIKNWIPDDMRL